MRLQQLFPTALRASCYSRAKCMVHILVMPLSSGCESVKRLSVRAKESAERETVAQLSSKNIFLRYILLENILLFVKYLV